MITPTSVSSRFKTRPVTPSPRSIISLSMASVRPSILATPSPSSRMLPTFCLAAAVLAPAICTSISINRLLMAPRFLETLFERCQPSLHAAVIHVAAHLDAHPGDQRRAVGEGRGDVRAVAAHETRLDGSLHIRTSPRSEEHTSELQ